jgi:SEC-C motif domain protein
MTGECPCGSGTHASGCCEPFLDGMPAPTAVALMRSRYTAYVRGAIDYLFATHDASTRAAVDRAGVIAWSRDTEWLGLEILATERGGPEDTEGIVEFVARGVVKGTPFGHRERSRFRRTDGAWFYVDGKTAQDPVRKVATAGRNDPCPCGSGMKYKRCHGA